MLIDVLKSCLQATPPDESRFCTLLSTESARDACLSLGFEPVGELSLYQRQEEFVKHYNFKLEGDDAIISVTLACSPLDHPDQRPEGLHLVMYLTNNTAAPVEVGIILDTRYFNPALTVRTLAAKLEAIANAKSI